MALGKYTRREVGGPPPIPNVRNGRIPLEQLRRLETQPHLGSGPGAYLYDPAALCWDAMTRAAAADDVRLRVLGGYRTFAQQVTMKALWTARGKPSYAATPGKSNHGWASAVDFDRYLPGALGWMDRNARRFGWDWPDWARDGRGTEEPWHVEFVRGWLPSDLPPTAPRVLVNGRDTGIPAFVRDGSAYLALRPLSEALRMSILIVDTAQGIAQVRRGDLLATLPLVLDEGRGYVPARSLTALGLRVEWAAGGVVLLTE